MSAQPVRSHLTIGEALAELRVEFPDVTISKIRFLESEGLIEPARSPSGYRRFYRADIERLRFILTAQRDHYLPLRVIKEHLDAGGHDPLGGMDGIGGGPGIPVPRSLVSVPADRPAPPVWDAGRLAAAAEVDEALIGELAEYHLLPAGGRYGPADLTVVQAVAALGRFGLTPRHLRVIRAAADREVALIDAAVTPTRRRRGVDAADRAAEAAREIAALAARLHVALVDAGLRGDR